MVDYEITYILRPSLEDAAVDERSASVAELITKAGGTIVHLEKFGKKRLAYEIKDLREGHYVTMQFRSEVAACKELDRQLSLDENVLRTLVVKLDKHELAALAIARAEVPELSLQPQV